MGESQNKTICKNCGTEIKEGNNFCTNCGMKVIEDKDIDKKINNQATESQKDKYSNKEKICIVLISAFVIFFMIFLLIKQGVIKIGIF